MPADEAGPIDDQELMALERPHPNLLTYFFILSLFTVIAFPIVFLVHFFKYKTLRYRFDDEGISVRWGLLFRREVHLTYARIQDIHLQSNIIERWLQLARLDIQTASGSSKAEMTVMGLLQFEALRDFIYARMRGTRELRGGRSATARPAAPAADTSELADVLRDVTAELREIRKALDERPPGAR